MNRAITLAEKIIEMPVTQFTDKVVDIPVLSQRQIFMVQPVQKTIEIPQLQYCDEVIVVPVVSVVQVPRVWVVEKTVEIPQPQIIEKIDETPEIQTAQEHSAVLAQLAPRLSGIMMKVDAGAGENPFVKVKGLITRLIDKPYCDEETSMAAEKEDLKDDTAKHSSLLETAVPNSTESVNEGHPDKICDQFSDAAPDACLTFDTKYKVTCDTCAKNNMVKAAGEITVAGKCQHETVVRNVVPNIGLDSFMDDLNSADSKRLTCKDCEVLFHVNKQSLDFASGVHVDTADFDIDEDGQDIMFGYAGDETGNVALLTSSMSTHVGKRLSVVAPRTAAQHRSIQSPQQRNLNKPEQQTEQGMPERERRQREEGEKGRKREKGRKGEGEMKGKERAAAEEGNEEVKKDVTDWVEVRRRTRRKSRKMVQIFVKVDGGKTSVMEMEMSDKVDDIVKKIPISDRDVYVTSGGRILKGSDKLEICEVRDGSTVEVTSRMRGGGRHKDKKSKSEKKRTINSERPEQKFDEESKGGEGSDEAVRRKRRVSEKHGVCPQEVKEKYNRKCRTIWREGVVDEQGAVRALRKWSLAGG